MCNSTWWNILKSIDWSSVMRIVYRKHLNLSISYGSFKCIFINFSLVCVKVKYRKYASQNKHRQTLAHRLYWIGQNIATFSFKCWATWSPGNAVLYMKKEKLRKIYNLFITKRNELYVCVQKVRKVEKNKKKLFNMKIHYYNLKSYQTIFISQEIEWINWTLITTRIHFVVYKVHKLLILNLIKYIHSKFCSFVGLFVLELKSSLDVICNKWNV